MFDDEVSYEPDLAGFAEAVSRLDVTEVLVVGEPSEILVASCHDVVPDLRFITDGPSLKLASRLDPGYYAVRSQGVRRVVIREGRPGTDVRSRTERLAHIADDWDALVIASDLANGSWASAVQVTDEDVWSVGTHVHVIGTNDFGRIVSHKRLPGALQYTVDVRGIHKTITSTQLSRLPGDVNDPHLWISLPPATAQEISLTVAWTKLRHPLTDVLYSFRASRTLFRPYQFKPVLKMIDGEDHRLLIADEVGLGKTIEAGLIWSELEGRNPLDRVLILCPASLTTKWQTEMERRFDRKLRLLGRSDWDDFLAALERGQQAPLFGVDSIERLRITDVPERLIECGARFDLIVIDEAHKLRNPGTATHALGQALADAADALVLLTATPVNLGNRDLFTLLGLLDEGRFSDQSMLELENEPNAIINRSAALLLDPDVHPQTVRATLMLLHDHPVGRSIMKRPDAMRLVQQLDTTAPLTPHELARAKRVLASLGMFSPYITRTRKVDVPDAKAVRSPHTLPVQWTGQERDFYQAVRSWVGAKARQQGTPPGFVEQMPLRQTASCIPAMAERMRLQAADNAPDTDADYLAEVGLVDETDDSTLPQIDVPVPAHDTKFEVLVEALDAVRSAGLSQVMIFSYFRLTLSYLDRRLRELGHTTRVMHGGVALADREQIMADFRAATFEILLISEVGSEGLDFEFCGALVNYDLPWNPMRVEQRIGRLDRFGQQHEKILIFNFAVQDTIEDRILLRLYERIGVFERSIGELEPIIAEEIDDLAVLMADVRLTPQEQEIRAHQIEVALSAKEDQIDQLRASEGSLTQLDKVLIDGFEDDNPGRGRFVGPEELALLMLDLANRTDSSVMVLPSSKALDLVGSPELAARLRDLLRRESHPNPGSLIQRIQDSARVRLALDPVEADARTPLLSVRHPLVRLAVDSIRADALALKRFGHVALSDEPKEQLVALLTLVEGTGLRSFLRLEPTVVDGSGAARPEVGDELLQAFSTGIVLPGILPVPREMASLYETAQAIADRVRLETERELQEYNTSLIVARRESLTHSTEVKMNATREQLAKATDHRIRRMHEGRLRNLRDFLVNTLHQLESSRAMVTTERVAVLVVDR
jgi:superfamily II DNA or RNA helicase